jgi:ribonuclease Z
MKHRNAPSRSLLRLAAATLIVATGLAMSQPAPAPHEPEIVVTLLGTGTPEPVLDRFSAATLVEAGGRRFLFDAGRGASIRLRQVGVPLGALEAVFLTHLHSDHVVGLPDVWLMGFINPVFGGRKGALRVHGPTGTGKLVANLALAYDADVQIRIKDQRVNPGDTKLVAEEFTGDGVVYDRDGVKVTAFAVNHGEYVQPAFGFRIDYAGRAVLISGDTKYDEKIVERGKGVDLLIHEVAEAPESMKTLPWVQAIVGHHTSAEEAGTVFAKARPKLAVYTHLVLLRGPLGQQLSIDDLVTKTRKTYGGPLVVGKDLMRIEVGSTVTVAEPPK